MNRLQKRLEGHISLRFRPLKQLRPVNIYFAPAMATVFVQHEA
jgi:hypothetical protein